MRLSAAGEGGAHQGDLEFAFELARLAASISLPRLRSKHFTVQVTQDGSPVTDVDVDVESALRARIAESRPDQMVVGEEARDSGASRWRWYLDPIDGTKRFIAGDPKWMTLIALAHDETILLGVVDLRALGQPWWATAGGDAFHDGERIAVSTRASLDEAIINDTWREDLARGNRDHPLWTISQRCAHIRPHQGHSMLAVACGQADIAMQVGSSSWDYAPLMVIVEEAGGSLTDFDGGDRIDTGRVVATNGHLHRAVLEVLWNRPT